MVQTRHNPLIRRRARRTAGFTLIELLTVIAIIATMMTVLLPAVFKAVEIVKRSVAEEILGRLTAACEIYRRDWEGLTPAVVENPSSTGLTPGQISGCQNMRLALVGCEIKSDTIGCRYQGGAEKLSDYAGSEKYVYAKKYSAEEFKPHKDLEWTSSSWSGSAAGDIEVFVDRYFEPARPVLYYRMRNGAFDFDDNAVYCTQSGETSGSWDSVKAKAIAAKKEYFLVWAGPDRRFFTDDDADSTGR